MAKSNSPMRKRDEEERQPREEQVRNLVGYLFPCPSTRGGGRTDECAAGEAAVPTHSRRRGRPNRLEAMAVVAAGRIRTLRPAHHLAPSSASCWEAG